jgi:hypothetical protein
MRSSSPFHFDPDPDSDPDFDEVFPNIILIAQVEKFRPVQLGHRMGAISYRNRYRDRYRDRILCFRKAALTLP